MSLKNIYLIVTKWFSKPWHPLVISAYPVVALMSANVGQIQNSAGVRSLLVSILFGAALYGLIWLFLRQAHKAALLTSLWLALFFSFGHIYIALDAKYPDVSYTSWLGVVWIVLFAASLFWIVRSKSTFGAAASTLNTIALTLLVMAVGQIIIESEPQGVSALGADHAPIEDDLTTPQNPPDVYYIILDSYAREDFLRTTYNYDNSEFIAALEDRGFYVGACSQSNYVRTEISLTSSLNMMYLPELDDEFKPESTARRTLWNSLKHSAVRHNFESMGYETVNFATGFAWNELSDADHFMTPPPFTSGLTEFEGLFLRTTLAKYAQDWGWVDPDAVMGQSFRDRFNNVFDSMDELANMPGPQFSYIHLISPHPPFVFDGKYWLVASRLGVSDREFWALDPVTLQCTQIVDLNPGPNQGVHSPIYQCGNGFLFIGNDGVHGIELWFLDTSIVSGNVNADVVDSAFEVYPNPFSLSYSKSINIYPKKEWKSITLFSIEGRVINCDVSLNKVKLDADVVKPGFYIVSAIDDDDVVYNSRIAIIN